MENIKKTLFNEKILKRNLEKTITEKYESEIEKKNTNRYLYLIIKLFFFFYGLKFVNKNTICSNITIL